MLPVTFHDSHFTSIIDSVFTYMRSEGLEQLYDANRNVFKIANYNFPSAKFALGEIIVCNLENFPVRVVYLSQVNKCCLF